MNKFPNDFVWGTATSSYQIEGAVDEGGRGRSIWDLFCEQPDRILNGDSGSTACNHYNLFKDDVKLMADLGIKAYRFSIAWPRIQPSGEGEPNLAGISFYNKLIDCLIDNDIEPWITLYHWDLPEDLYLHHQGWLSSSIMDKFGEYARICFESFGDRVKHWITLNEPWCSAVLGYGNGHHAPGHKSNTEPYIAAHNLLLSHARAVEVYRDLSLNNDGVIGITNNCDYRFPLTQTDEDINAAERSLEFFIGWFADPIWKGDYPQIMKELVGNRLPKFTEDEKKLILGSSDFFGLNHYSSMLASEPNEGIQPEENIAGNGGMFEDQLVHLSDDPNWKKTHMEWNVVPEGCKELLKWIDKRYNKPTIYITENGCAQDEPTLEAAQNDEERVQFFKGYINACYEAIQDDVNLKGYFAWSLMDNFEWAWGYDRRFGLCRVDFNTFERSLKKSAHWYKEVIKNNSI